MMFIYFILDEYSMSGKNSRNLINLKINFIPFKPLVNIIDGVFNSTGTVPQFC